MYIEILIPNNKIRVDVFPKKKKRKEKHTRMNIHQKLFVDELGTTFLGFC